MLVWTGAERNFYTYLKGERIDKLMVFASLSVLIIAMKQGCRIHKELENELHETVAFTQITTAEEVWALRYLNILFGLRELQLHGMTVHPLIFH